MADRQNNEKSIADLHLLIRSNAVVLFRKPVAAYRAHRPGVPVSGADAFHVVTTGSLNDGEWTFSAHLLFEDDQDMQRVAAADNCYSDTWALDNLLKALQECLEVGPAKGYGGVVRKGWQSYAHGSVDVRVVTGMPGPEW